jgi:hypothetical protein
MVRRRRCQFDRSSCIAPSCFDFVRGSKQGDPQESADVTAA